MKPTRIFATASLIISSVALITAANLSVGDEPGVVRMSSYSPQDGTTPTPTPDPMGAGTATMPQPPTQPSPYPQPGPYAPYFERSMSATETVPNGAFFAPQQPFGPIMMLESNFDQGLGFDKGYNRFNLRSPYHIVPNQTVLMGDLSASVTNNGDPLGNAGLVYRNYDEARNRVFGVNLFGDYDQGYGNNDWYRMTAGFESLGKYIDFRANGYFVLGNDSTLISSTLDNNVALSGFNAYMLRNQVRENAYSGFDMETGGPLPFLGRYGINMYAGLYFLGNDTGYDATGFQARWEALITQNLTVNTYLTSDDTFGTNSWVSLQYSIPNYKNRRILKPRIVCERLQDPVVRSTRIHSHIDSVISPEACINPLTGVAFNLFNVDPNATVAGIGTFENPFNTLQAAALANNNGVDVIRVKPRNDDTGTNLTVNGGMDLFDDQTLLSSIKTFALDPNCIIPGLPTLTNLGPLISNPTMVAGGSVVRVGNNDQIIGMRIDGANAAGTVFGNGVSNPLPITDINLNMNTFTNYTIGANLQDVSGDTIISMNTFTGLAGTSTYGLNLTAAGGQTMNLLVDSNTATNNSVAGLSVVAKPGATINAFAPNEATAPTGIVNNTTTGNGDGIVLSGGAGSTINAVVENNTSTNNTQNGFLGETDNGTYNLFSLRNNTFSLNGANGTFLHYQNGGIFNAVSEDADGDGSLDAGEDLNGNGDLDEGIVTNTMSGNIIAGLCIFGEDASAGVFDIGGPATSLGNTFVGNLNAGIAMDLQDTATGQMDTLNNLISAIPAQNTAPTLTFILDFVEAGQTINDPFGGGTFTPFDLVSFGFAPTDFDLVTNAVLQTVQSHYYGIPTTGNDSRSPIPDGQQLDVNFVIGDLGSPPSIGATEFYTAVIGSVPTPPALGIAFLNSVRDATGSGPLPGFTNGSHVASIFSNSINSLGSLTPADIVIPDEPAGIEYDIAQGDGTTALHDALTSGNLTFTRNALAGTISHEIGHTLSLSHMNVAGSVTPTGVPPIMGTGAIDLPNQARIGRREFGYTGFDGQSGNAPIAHVQQLVDALGTRAAAVGGASGDGIRVTAVDSSVLEASTFINNRILQNGGDGIEVFMQDNAVAEGLTIQGNTITDNGGRGIDLHADGAGAFIDADSTIGGTGTNILAGATFSQGNTITGNQSDGFRALAANGGTIHGNLFNNLISQNAGNGVALSIDNGGEIDFGTPASNRIIQGNTISRNGGAGIALTSNVSATTEALMNVVVQGNTISQNVSGGIISNLNGPNNPPPALPAVNPNNVLNLTVGGTPPATANTINGNGDAGIAVNVTGNGFANVNISNTTITGTTNGPDPILDGDGINLRRQDSSLLTAVIDNVTSTGNAGDGIDVDAQGNDKNDPNQPFSGTPNTVTINDSNFSNNGQNGARFRTRGDSTLIGDITGSTFSNNGLNGILVHTSENSSFGDPTIGLPPGRRSRFEGIVAEENGVDGVQILATENSRALVEITGNALPAGLGAHAAASTLGATSISRNGRDGVRITTTGGRSDILITSGTATTTIDGNGTVAGGNGIRWDASGTSEGVVRVTRTTITNNIAGITEVTTLNGNGILDPGEDVNGNGVLDPGEDVNANQNIDVAEGDGIQFNAFNDTTSTLIVGNVGEGNVIQNNGDDGIAVTATGRNLTGNPRPVITITDNTIGGTSNGITAGNNGDGVSLNVLGGTAVGIAPANVDFSITAASPQTDLFNGRVGVTESGAVPQFTMSNNLVSNNNLRGVNVQLTGASGTRDRENGNSLFDPVRITLDDNTIVSNGEEGIFYRADAEMNQSRFIFLPNFPDPPVTGLQNLNYSPFRAEFASLNFGSVNGNTAYAVPYLNLRTVQNSFLTLTSNTIQNNGTNTVTGEGIRIDVGTGSYVAADIQNNVFGGNLEEDVVTSSFNSFGNTFDSVDTNGDLTFDYVYLDDTAQLDMRFQDNSGNQIAPSDVGALYTNNDLLKQTFFGFPAVIQREASFFQVDNGPNLNNPNNTFTNFAITQDIQAAFTNGGYNLRLAADPLFPNIGFAPYLP